jgi:cytochrome P450
VAWSSKYGGFWVVTGYDELAAVVRDDQTFSSANIAGTPQQGLTVPGQPKSMATVPQELDPPEFLVYRRLLNPYFSPAAAAKWTPLLEDVTTACLDEVIESGNIDFVLDLANPVTAIFTLRFLGVPTTDWEHWARPFHDAASCVPGTPERAAALAALQDVTEQLRELVLERRARPADGLVSDLANATLDGELLPLERVVGAAFLTLAGGVDTTTALTADALHWLAAHPHERVRLAEDPALIKSACEEFLRYFAPVQALARTAMCPVELGGQQIAPGDRVLLSWAAANRDETVFPEPDQLLIDRLPNRHTSFGLGAHRCIGSNYARESFAIMLRAVLNRMPDYVIDAEAQPNSSIGLVNGWVNLPAHFSPAPRSGNSSLAELASIAP